MFILLHFYLFLGALCPVLSQDLKAVTVFGVSGRSSQGTPCTWQGSLSRTGYVVVVEGLEAEEQAHKRL